MNLFTHLKTSDKITYSFGAFHIISLIVFFLLINVGYFFSWYNDQKEESLRDMNKKYSLFSMPESDMEIEEFTAYLLEKDTLIIPDTGKSICSPNLSKKIHSNMDIIEKSYFYRFEGKTYFIFSQYYEKVGKVHILFDTTPYVKAQLMILKISLFFILLSSLFYMFIGVRITRNSLRGLKKIAQKAQSISLDDVNSQFEIQGPKQDEIRIVGETLNSMLKKIEKQTSQLKQFTTDVSHEFKTPLMIMSSHIDLIEKKYPKIASEMSTHLRKSIRKLNTLIETLLFIARFESKSDTLSFQKISVKKFIEKREEEIKKIFIEKDISVSYAITNHLSYKVDEITFQILIDNLLTNACKFSLNPVEIEIRADEKGFSVQDFGKGLSEAEKNHLYEKFYRADTTTSGFGVGLFLVKRIVEMYHWHISVESETGKGTTFFIQFK